VAKALEGLPGVAKVEMDVGHDLFRITYAAGSTADTQAALNAVKDLGYTPSIVKADQFHASAAKKHPAGGIPPFIQKALDRAKAEGKLILVDCTAEW
jgi:copper chaperone CopZ